jgi:hypothetical protein
MAERARNDRRERVMPEIVLRSDSNFICENELRKVERGAPFLAFYARSGAFQKFRREERLPEKAYDPRN